MERKFRDSGIEWIGEIPEEWKTPRLKNVAELHGRIGWNGLRSEEFEECSFAYLVTGQDFISSEVCWENCYQINEARYNEDLFIQLKNGELLITKDGTIGKIAIVSNLDKPACLNSGIFVLRQSIGVFVPKYLYWQLYSPMLMSFNRYMNLGGTTINHLYQNVFERMPLLLPAYIEQQAIADFLDEKCGEIDQLVELQQQMIEELKAYKQSIITEAVTKGLNPDVPMKDSASREHSCASTNYVEAQPILGRKLKDSGIEWIGEIPESWNINKLIRVFNTIGSGTTPKSEDENVFEGEINWIQSGDINGGILIECKNKISEEVLKKYTVLKVYKSPFIIIAMYGASVGNISISMIDGCTNQACCVLSHSSQNFKYLFYANKSAKDYLIYMAEGGGQPNISQDKLKGLWIPIPPIDEQQAIADYLDQKCSEIDQLIEIKQNKISELKEYKKSLIFEYVTGKKQVV